MESVINKIYPWGPDVSCRILYWLNLFVAAETRVNLRGLAQIIRNYTEQPEHWKGNPRNLYNEIYCRLLNLERVLEPYYLSTQHYCSGVLPCNTPYRKTCSQNRRDTQGCEQAQYDLEDFYKLYIQYMSRFHDPITVKATLQDGTELTYVVDHEEFEDCQKCIDEEYEVAGSFNNTYLGLFHMDNTFDVDSEIFREHLDRLITSNNIIETCLRHRLLKLPRQARLMQVRSVIKQTYKGLTGIEIPKPRSLCKPDGRCCKAIRRS